MRPLPVAWGWSLAALALLLAPQACAATNCPGEGCVRVRPQDQVVLISSRPIGCSTDHARIEAGLHAEQLADLDADGRREWKTTPWRSVVAAADATMPTIVFTHGNKISWGETRARGLYVYGRLVRSACDDRPIRFLIWSWCADEIKGPLRDFREKAARTGPVGKQLGYVLSTLPAESRFGLLGYSYGARVSSGALQELGSGELSGPPRSARAFYLAAAFDADWLGRGRRHGDAMDATDKLIMTINNRDPAMKYFELLGRNYDPQAMGYAGPTCLDRERAQRVRLINVTSSVGRSHDLCDYVSAPGVMRKAWSLLTYADQDAAEVEVADSGANEQRQRTAIAASGGRYSRFAGGGR
ncbi:hypothetical protein [Posidoniimonas polymericola]|uniref:hypothetical protein n=1 Tax=Posidoniimonas polymericola TaxID=2528002 RepID=UPI0011B669A1|nr:hypothetical protein [Posidoniimonas polymericola]